MEITRRGFLKTSALVAGMAALGPKLGPLSTIAQDAGKARDRAKQIVTTEDVLIPSTCVMCVNFCGIRVRRVNGVIRQIYGNPDSPYNMGNMCPKGQAGIFDAYNPYRVKAPLKRTNPNKGLGENPRWKEIGWEEAFEEVASRLKRIKSDDPRKLQWMHGHGKYLVQDKFPKALMKAFGTPNVSHRTTICEAARHVADEITWGYHGFLPDIGECKYMLNFGANYFEAEQFARWLDRKTLDAKEKGMKLVVIEPRLSKTAAKADEWIPIRPATDVVFVLAMANELINNGYVDRDFLNNYTNAPNLVGDDGKFLRNGDGKELVWDAKAQAAKPLGEGMEPALTGSYTVDGKKGRPALQVLQDSISDVTPEYASGVCDVPADTIRRIAREFGENAKIGSTVVKDGQVLRYRPVDIHTFRGMAAHEYGVQNWRAGLIVLMLVGAVDAVGGINLHSVYASPMYMKPGKVEYPPNRIDLAMSVYFPNATHDVAQQVGVTLANPEAYGLPYKPEMWMTYASNRVFSCSDTATQIEGFKKYYGVAIDIALTEQADLADIVLPNKSYLEVWHWASTRYTLEYSHDAIRQPVVNVYNLPYDESDIFMELAERVGILDGYIELINQDWKTSLAPGKKYSGREIVAAIAKAKGKSLEYFSEHGLAKKKLGVKDVYLKGVEAKFKGPGEPKMHFYCEELVDIRDTVRQVVRDNSITNVDIGKSLDIDLSPLPLKEHARPTPHREAPADFDLFLITYTRMYLNQSGNALNPLLRHVAHDSDDNFALMHPDTLARKGINDGDEVHVESRLGRIKTRVKATQGIRPDTVAISYHYGHWSTSLPGYAKKGANPNWIVELHPDRISGMNSFNDSKVKVYK